MVAPHIHEWPAADHAVRLRIERTLFILEPCPYSLLVVANALPTDHGALGQRREIEDPPWEPDGGSPSTSRPQLPASRGSATMTGVQHTSKANS